MSSQKMPWRAVGVVLVVQFSEAFQIVGLFPYVAFMVADFPGISEAHVGTLAGLVAAAFAFGQFLTSYWWGKCSDRFGVRRVVLLSLLCTTTCVFIFGFSKWYAMAFVARLLSGLLNGNIGVLKSFLGKVTNSHTQARAFAMLSVSWGTGSIVAPAINGVLARPALTWPNTFSETGLFGQFPYLLCALVNASVSLLAFFTAFVFLREPHEYKYVRDTDDDEEEEGEVKKEGHAMTPNGSEMQKCVHDTAAQDEEIEMQSIKKERGGDSSSGGNTDDEGIASPALSPAVARTGRTANDDASALDKRTLADAIVDNDTPLRHPSSMSRARKLLSSLKTTDEQRTHKSTTHKSGTYTQLTTQAQTQTQTSTAHQQNPLVRMCVYLRHRLFPSDLPLLPPFLYSGLAFIFIARDETLPLFCREPVSRGGLEMSPKDIGITLLMNGIFTLLFPLLCIPHLKSRFGILRLYRFGLFLFLPALLMLPFSHLVFVTSGRVAMWIFLFVMQITHAVSGSLSFTASMLCVVNSVDEKNFGRINGLGQSLASLMRAVGPLLAGVMWSGFMSLQDVPFHYGLSVIVQCCIAFVVACFTFRLSPSLDMPMKEWRKFQRLLAASDTLADPAETLALDMGENDEEEEGEKDTADEKKEEEGGTDESTDV